MRSIGILSSDFIGYHESDDLSYENKRIIRAAKELFQKCVLLDPSRISLRISNNTSELYYEENNKNILPLLDCILVRRSRGFSEQIYDIVRAINYFHPRILLFDPAESFITPVSKVSSFIKRHGHFNQPQTLIITSLNLDNIFIPENFPFPVMVKPTHGFKGRHIKKCYSKQEVTEHIKHLSKLSKNPKEYQTIGYGFLIQEFIEFSEEYRVNVIDGKSIGCVIKIGEKDIKNADQGAVFARKHNQTVIDIAEKCAMKSNLFFAGVDVAKGNGQYYVLECNRNPAFEHFDEALNTNTARLLLEKISQVSQNNLANDTNKEKTFPLSTKIPDNISQNQDHEKHGVTIINQIFNNPDNSNQTKYAHESNELIEQLIEIISNSNLEDLNKSYAISYLNSIKAMKDKPNDSDIIQSIESKLESLNNILNSSTSITKITYPIIQKLATLFGFQL